MPFRDSYRADDNAVPSGYVQQEFRPVRDLIGSVIDTVRSNRERRIQARHERELAKHGISISDNFEHPNRRTNVSDRSRTNPNYIPDIDGPQTNIADNRKQPRQDARNERPQPTPAEHSILVKPVKPEPTQAEHSVIAPETEPTPAEHSILVKPVKPEPTRAEHSVIAPESEPTPAEHSVLVKPDAGPSGSAGFQSASDLPATPGEHSVLVRPENSPQPTPAPIEIEKKRTTVSSPAPSNRDIPLPMPEAEPPIPSIMPQRREDLPSLPSIDTSSMERGNRGIPLGYKLVSVPDGADDPPETVDTQEPVAEFPSYDEPPIGERIFPDTLTVKERSGQLYEIPEQKNLTSDQRLEGYLKARGTQLSELDVNATSITDAGLGLLNAAPNLNKLMLNDCDVDNNSMKILGAQGLRNLQELNLHSTRVGDEGVGHIRTFPISNLNLSDTVITDECMNHLKAMKALQVVNFDYSGIGNEGIKALKDMPNLRSVSLKGTSITDDAVADLAKAKQLLVLNLEDTKLTPDKVAWLQKSMPKTVITAPDGGGAAQGMRRTNPFEQPRRFEQQQEKHKPFRLPHFSRRT